MISPFRPLNHLHEHIMEIMDDAVDHGDCSNNSHRVMHQYLSTVVFPCNYVATTYYPCTLEQLNTDAMECYSNNGVIVRNALVPTPGSLSNADEMCRFVIVSVCIVPVFEPSFCQISAAHQSIFCSTTEVKLRMPNTELNLRQLSSYLDLNTHLIEALYVICICRLEHATVRSMNSQVNKPLSNM